MQDQMIARGRWVIPDSEQVIDDGAVLIEGDLIMAVGTWAELHANHPGAEVLGSDSVAVLPGLVNAHHHSAGATARVMK